MMANKLTEPYTWSLTPKAELLRQHFLRLGVDEDIAFELVELHLGDEDIYDLEEEE